MKKEIFRKAFHTFFGIIFLLLIYFLGVASSLWIILVCFLIGLIVALLHRNGKKIPWLEKVLFRVEREHEKKFPGKAALLFFVSALILLLVFGSEPKIVLAALSVEIFADSAAAIVGKGIGKHKILRKKTLEGTLACFIIAIICLLFFFPLRIALFAALIATIIEVLPGEDNLWVPLVTGALLKALILI